jgi:shikimate dehydrogenase/3-dehydroquinate dehydratase type I
MSPSVVLSILESSVEAAGRRLERVPDRCDLVEIRADELVPADVESLVARSPRPVIVTVRAEDRGGRFQGGSDEQWDLLRAGLRAGAAFADVELDGPLARLAWSTHAPRVILSHHGAPCETEELVAVYRAMAATPAARLKIVPRAERPAEIPAIRELLAVSREDQRPLACFALGPAGQVSRLFAPSWGSWGTYGAVAPGSESADGQLPVEDLLDLYDVLAIGDATRRFALVGSGVTRSPSPAMHAAGYREAGLDGRYVPIEAENLDTILPLLLPGGALGLEAFAVTKPLKEEIGRRCRLADDVAKISRAVNTVLIREDGWVGHNTDGPAALALIRKVLDPSGARVAIAGAGGAARGIGAALSRAGARVTLFGRTPERRESAALALGVLSQPLEGMPSADWDVFVQATPLGRRGERILPATAIRGKVVLDLAYGPEPTPLVREARTAGLAVFDGLDLLAAQGSMQFELMTGVRVREGTLLDAAHRQRARRDPS